MAEANPPRKTKTLKEFSTMNSQDQRYGVENDEFFWLENIMRVGDAKLRSVPGPSTTNFAPFPPLINSFVIGSPALDYVVSFSLDFLAKP